MDDNWRYPYFRPPNDSCTTIGCCPRRRRKFSSLRQVLFSPSAMTASFFSGGMRSVGQKPSHLSHVVMISSNQSFEFNGKCSAALFFQPDLASICQGRCWNKTSCTSSALGLGPRRVGAPVPLSLLCVLYIVQHVQHVHVSMDLPEVIRAIEGANDHGIVMMNRYVSLRVTFARKRINFGWSIRDICSKIIQRSVELDPGMTALRWPYLSSNCFGSEIWRPMLGQELWKDQQPDQCQRVLFIAYYHWITVYVI